MGIHIERYNGPSKLDERLEHFRDVDTRQVMLSPDEAKEVLLESLLGFYRSQVGRMDSKIVALLSIAGSSEKDKKHNFRHELEGHLDARRTVREAYEKMRREASIITPRGPEQPEI